MWLFLNLSTVPSHNAMFTQVSRVDVWPSHLWMAISNHENYKCGKVNLLRSPGSPSQVYLYQIIMFIYLCQLCKAVLSLKDMITFAILSDCHSDLACSGLNHMISQCFGYASYHTSYIPAKPLHNYDTVSLHFNHFYCTEICDKLSDHSVEIMWIIFV